jgi:UDP-N-acetylmuramoylalanine--D-glutamate ligase
MCAPGESFRGKNITMLGLGLLGRGINVAKFLAEHGAILTITDLKTKEQLQSSLDELSSFSDITYVLGEHRFEDFENKDMIIKAAGVPLDSPYITHARERGIPIEMDASLFIKKAPPDVVTIGITGTRGKSTVTHLIHHILKESGRNVFLGGNVKGTATLPLLKEVSSGDIVVLELDSWQLQGFGDSQISPHIAVFASFMRDHMNYYKGDMQAYFNDKAHIFSHQQQEDVLIVSTQAWGEIQERFKGEIQSKVIIVDEEEIELNIPGAHNRVNALLAIEACVALGVERAYARELASSFEGIQYRLELVR